MPESLSRRKNHASQVGERGTRSLAQVIIFRVGVVAVSDTRAEEEEEEDAFTSERLGAQACAANATLLEVQCTVNRTLSETNVIVRAMTTAI